MRTSPIALCFVVVALCIVAAIPLPYYVGSIAAVIAAAIALIMATSVARSARHSANFASGKDEETLALHATLQSKSDAIGALSSTADDVIVRHERLGNALAALDETVDETRNASKHATVGLEQLGEGAMFLSRSVGDSSAAIEEMVSSITLVSSNIGNLADTVTSVSSAIGELAVSISQVAGNAQEASTLSSHADTKARGGGEAVERLVESTREIANDIGSVVKKMEQLGAASERIGNIVEVIDTIADQTNLLALNAAIEAARAGEHGRGFAVVADEVRKLAENSASSTKEIGSLIRDIQTKTGEVVRSTTASGNKAASGLEMADLAGRAIDDILDAVAQATNLIEQISNSAREQASASTNIVNSVEQMNQLMREAARSLDEQNTSNQQMMATITNMQRLTDLVAGTVQDQRAACKDIETAATRLESAAAHARDTSAGIEDAAHALRDRAALAVAGRTPPSTAVATQDVFARLASSN